MCQLHQNYVKVCVTISNKLKDRHQKDLTMQSVTHGFRL